MSELDLLKVSTPRTARVLKRALQLERDNARLRSELEAALDAIRLADGNWQEDEMYTEYAHICRIWKGTHAPIIKIAHERGKEGK